MISRHEFHIALTTALAALTAPEPHPSPMPGNGAARADVVCFDFWPGESLRVVGTNGTRLVVVYCHVPGLPHAGKFLMSRADAVEALRVFAPPAAEGLPGVPAGPPVTLQAFGLDCMLLTSGEDALMVQCAHGVLYPEYHLMITGDTLPQKGAIFDVEALRWALDLMGEGDLRMHIRAHGPTTFRPVLSGEFTSITDMVIAIKPKGLVS